MTNNSTQALGFQYIENTVCIVVIVKMVGDAVIVVVELTRQIVAVIGFKPIG